MYVRSYDLAAIDGRKVKKKNHNESVVCHSFFMHSETREPSEVIHTMVVQEEETENYSIYFRKSLHVTLESRKKRDEVRRRHARKIENQHRTTSDEGKMQIWCENWAKRVQLSLRNNHSARRPKEMIQCFKNKTSLFPAKFHALRNCESDEDVRFFKNWPVVSGWEILTEALWHSGYEDHDLRGQSRAAKFELILTFSLNSALRAHSKWVHRSSRFLCGRKGVF